LRPPFEPIREVRFAVVLYGGVSLAIYINGVVQELFRLVRATAPVHPLPEASTPQVVYHPTTAHPELPPALKGSELVYRELGQMLPNGRDRPRPGAAIRTRFVIDIVSGTSAGGINGIFLAKAIAMQQPLDQLRDLWMDEADIGLLLNDRPSYKGLPQAVRRAGDPPPSLLNGQRLFDRALEALKGMADKEEVPAKEDVPAGEVPQEVFVPSYAEQLDLAVTTTDLQGLRLPLRLQDRVIYERRHRNVLRFVYATEDATGSKHNDFAAHNDPLLAFAARATSSFPFAFEPARLTDAALVAHELREAEPWNSFFPDYVDVRAPFEEYSFADGGYLDNKPFSYATEALAKRRADLPVDRKLIYVEPAPTDPSELVTSKLLKAEDVQPKPDALANVMDAVLKLPRAEPIRDDIAAVIVRNRRLAEIAEVTRAVDDEINRHDPLEPIHAMSGDVADVVLDAALEGAQLPHRAYRELRTVIVLDNLASLVTRQLGLREDSDYPYAIRLILRSWFDRRTPRNTGRFLHGHDLSYRLRRIWFVQDRINALLAAPNGTEAEALRKLKLQLNAIAVNLRREGRRARKRPAGRGEPTLTGIHEAVEAVGLNRKKLLEVLAAPAEDYVQLWELETKLDDLAEALRVHFEPQFSDADRKARVLLGGEGVPADDRKKLVGWYRRFETYDLVQLPLTYPDLGEAAPVDVVRVSPVDAPSLVNESASDSAHKLAGTAVGHFGGFLEREWRANDLLWGRLDGAERILAALLPPGDVREDLRERAQIAILREEVVDRYVEPITDRLAQKVLPKAPKEFRAALARQGGKPAEAGRAELCAALGQLSDDALLEGFKDCLQARDLDPPAALRTAGRAMQITGKVLGAVTDRYRIPTRPLFWLTRIGRLVWGVGEVAMPRGSRPSVAALMFRHWSQLAILIALILILAGVLGAEGAQKVGWLLLGAVVLARALAWLAGSPIRRQRRVLLALCSLLVLVILGAAGLELGLHASHDADTAATALPGNRAGGDEHWLRNAWSELWPWDEQQPAKPARESRGSGRAPRA
jgi:patatin-related protein